MQTVHLSALLHLILPRAVGCPNVVAEQQAKLAVIEFCEFTKAWRQTISMAMTTNPRALLAPFGAAIHQITEATFNGRKLHPVLMEDARLPALGEEPAEGQPRTMTQIEAGTIILDPFQAGTLKAVVVLKPRGGQGFGIDPEYPLRDGFCIAPAALIASYSEALANGALARILTLPNQPFTDPAMAAYYRSEFERVKGEVQRAVYRGQQGAAVRVKPQWM